MKEVAEASPAKKDYAWMKYAALTSLCMGFINFLLGDLSARLGVAGSFPLFYGIVFMGILYHIFVKDSTAVYFTIDEEGGKKFHWAAFWGIVIRGLNHMCLISMTCISFAYASYADINQGVIASLFTSGVIFTSVLFFFIYDEALTMKDLLGIVFILAGVALIGFGKEQATGDEEVITVDGKQDMYKWLSILFAVLCGFSFALNSFVMKHYPRKFNFDVVQLNLDGYLICAIILSTGYFLTGPSAYSLKDVMMAVAASVLSLIGTASMTHAFKTGKGGPIQAIDSLKVLVPLLMNILLHSQIPTWMQIAGMVSGFFGALIISFKQSEKRTEAVKEPLLDVRTDKEDTE